MIIGIGSSRPGPRSISLFHEAAPHQGLFDEQLIIELLNALNNLLPRLAHMVEWDAFRPLIDGVFPVTDPRKGGRPPFDGLMLFKVLILQRIYDLSDDAANFQITDRLRKRGKAD